jgi:uncharacterized membrane protein
VALEHFKSVLGILVWIAIGFVLIVSPCASELGMLLLSFFITNLSLFWTGTSGSVTSYDNVGEGS